MESLNIADIYEEAFVDYEQEPPLMMHSVMQEEILWLKIRTNRFFKSLIFGLPISIFMWVIIIWFFLSFLCRNGSN